MERNVKGDHQGVRWTVKSIDPTDKNRGLTQIYTRRDQVRLVVRESGMHIMFNGGESNDTQFCKIRDNYQSMDSFDLIDVIDDLRAHLVPQGLIYR